MKKTFLFLTTLIILNSCTKENANPVDKFLGTYKGAAEMEMIVGGSKYYDNNSDVTLTVTKDNNGKYFFNDGVVIYEVFLTAGGTFQGNYKQTVNIQNTAVTFNAYVAGDFSNDKAVYNEYLIEQNKLMSITLKNTLYKR